MKTAFVFTESPDTSGKIRKTVVVKEVTVNSQGQETESYEAFVIIADLQGLLTEPVPFEIPFTEEIPEINFINEHTIPVPTGNGNEVHLNINDPANSRQG